MFFVMKLKLVIKSFKSRTKQRCMMIVLYGRRAICGDFLYCG